MKIVPFPLFHSLQLLQLPRLKNILQPEALYASDATVIIDNITMELRSCMKISQHIADLFHPTKHTVFGRPRPLNLPSWSYLSTRRLLTAIVGSVTLATMKKGWKQSALCSAVSKEPSIIEIIVLQVYQGSTTGRSKYIVSTTGQIFVQIEHQIFRSLNSMSSFEILKNSKLICDTNGVCKGAATCTFYFFKTKIAFAALIVQFNAKRCHKKNNRLAGGKTSHFTTYIQVAIFLWNHYVTGNIVLETDARITRFARPSRITASHLATNFAEELLFWKYLYKSSTLNKMFIEGLDDSIRYSLHRYYKWKRQAIQEGPLFTLHLYWSCKEMISSSRGRVLQQ